MLDEIFNFIGTLEWQGHKPDKVERTINRIAYYLMVAASGYMAGQTICIIFDIGIVGHQWRQEKSRQEQAIGISNREITTSRSIPPSYPHQ